MAGRPLPSWREGAARSTILGWLDRATGPGPGHVPLVDRVAVFDNDGTLWTERPTYTQALFIADRLRAAAAVDAGLAADPVLQALLTGGLGAAMAHGLDALAGLVLKAQAGMTADAFLADARSWFTTSRHPSGRPYPATVYQPMLELLDLLRSHDFRSFIVTGGGVEFVRAVSWPLYGIPPADVIGTAVQLRLERHDGRAELVREAAFDGPPNEGAPKAVNIHRHIGQRPVIAVGNSDGDREMLEYVATGEPSGLCLLLEHDDPEREDVYGGRSVTTDPDAEPVGTVARRSGWTVISMRSDWAQVFPAAPA